MNVKPIGRGESERASRRERRDGMRWISTLVVAAGTCLASSRGFAQTAPDNSVGLDVAVGPRYPGASSYRVLPLPAVSLSTRLAASNATLFVRGLDAGVSIALGRYAEAGVLFGVQPGRRESDAAILGGTGNIATSLQYGLFTRVHYGPASADLRFLQSAHSGYGNHVTLGVSYALVASDADRVNLSANVEWSNASAQQTWFGIDGAQAANSTAGLPEYHPSAGFSRANLRLSWDHRVSEHWSLHGAIGYGTLLGDAADSPVVEHRSAPFGSVGAAYHF